MSTLALWMKCILLLVSNVAASIDGNATTSYYNSSVELYQEGDVTEEPVNSSTTQSPGVTTQSPGVTTPQQPPGTSDPGPGVSTEPLPLSAALPTGVRDGDYIVLHLYALCLK